LLVIVDGGSTSLALVLLVWTCFGLALDLKLLKSEIKDLLAKSMEIFVADARKHLKWTLASALCSIQLLKDKRCDPVR